MQIVGSDQVRGWVGGGWCPDFKRRGHMRTWSAGAYEGELETHAQADDKTPCWNLIG